MPSDTPAGRKSFSIFRSAAEEAAMKVDEEQWDNEGGPAGASTSASAPQVIHTPGVELPYHVVLARPRGQALHHSFATMREAETYIRRNSPAPTPGLSKLYDRPATKA